MTAFRVHKPPCLRSLFSFTPTAFWWSPGDSLESLGIPLPGETALIVAAAIAGPSHSVSLNIYEVILTAAAASIVGRTIGYYIGREFGYCSAALRLLPAHQ